MTYVDPRAEAVRLLRKAEKEIFSSSQNSLSLAVADRYIALAGTSKGSLGIHMPDEVAVVRSDRQVTVTIKRDTVLSEEEIGQIVTDQLRRESRG